MPAGEVTPVILRDRAFQDMEEVIAHYVEEGPEQATLRFADALRRAYAHIGRHPASGSPRWAQELNIPGLRSWPVGRFPHLILYVERQDHVDVWRVIDGRRDIPSWMQEPMEGP